MPFYSPWPQIFPAFMKHRRHGSERWNQCHIFKGKLGLFIITDVKTRGCMKSMPNNSGSIVGQELGLKYMITLVTSCSWISTAQSVGDLIGLIVGQEFLKYMISK